MPAVALESAVLTHGLPHPINVETALRLEDVVREGGGTPATVGVVDGQVLARLSEDQLRRLGSSSEVVKLSLRDLPVAVARRHSGGTTVAATLHVAAAHGIRVFATGGIGGVHRTSAGEASRDVSADLPALARYPVCTVCAGAKAVLDVPATLEMLETLGVTVLGFGTDEFPAFYSRSSGLPVEARVDSAEAVAQIVIERQRLRLQGAVLVAVPVPAEQEIARGEIEPAIARAVEEAGARGLQSAGVTPFLLQRLAELTEDRSLAANLALLENNVRIATRIAVALDRLSEPQPIVV